MERRRMRQADGGPAVTERRRRSRRLEANPNAWLEPLIGIAHFEGPGDVSSNKKQYLAETYYGKRAGPSPDRVLPPTRGGHSIWRRWL
jgi:hypothetical protein